MNGSVEAEELLTVRLPFVWGDTSQIWHLITNAIGQSSSYINRYLKYHMFHLFLHFFIQIRDLGWIRSGDEIQNTINILRVRRLFVLFISFSWNFSYACWCILSCIGVYSTLAYCLLPIAYCLLPIGRSPLHIAYCVSNWVLYISIILPLLLIPYWALAIDHFLAWAGPAPRPTSLPLLGPLRPPQPLCRRPRGPRTWKYVLFNI